MISTLISCPRVRKIAIMIEKQAFGLSKTLTARHCLADHEYGSCVREDEETIIWLKQMASDEERNDYCLLQKEKLVF